MAPAPGDETSQQTAIRLLDETVTELRGLRADLAQFAEQLAQYQPVIDRAAALINSPAARAARLWRN